MSDRRNGATYRAITGGRSPRTETTDWMTSLQVFIRAHGSETAAARALDVPRRTLRNWLGKFGKPTTPPADRKARVVGLMVRAQRRARLAPGREKRLRAAKVITISGIDRYDGEDREVSFYVGQGSSTGITGDVMNKLIDGYLLGADGLDGQSLDQNGGLAGFITRRLTDPWYRDFFNDSRSDWGIDIHEVKFT